MFMSDSMKAPSDTFETAILKVLSDAGNATLSAPEIAQAIATEDQEWHSLLTPIRQTAVRLAQSGHMVIYRKGKPVDPTDFRGVYRLGLPRHD
jgi:hypothetical protein